MKYKILLFSLLISSLVFSQVNFKMELKKANPVSVNPPEVSIEEIIKMHKAYLNKAIIEKDISKQLYGNLYLFVDYYKAQDYVSLNKHLLDAEVIVSKTNNYSWKGAIHMRKALVSDLNDDKKDVLKQYQLALENCRKANDSVCIGESLEQLSTTYGQIKNFEKAHYYFQLALPILTKFADKQQMALTYNNYSNLLSREGNYSESKIYIDSAIAMTIKNKDLYKQMMYENNKASLLTKMKNYEQAISIFEKSEAINIKNKWADRLKQNYIGLSVLYEAKNDYKNAFYYLKEFYLLKDSINGLDVSLKIADLNAKYEAQSKEVSLKEARLKIIESERKLEKIYGLLLFLGIVILLIIYGFIQNFKKSKKELAVNQEKLLEAKDLLIQKNNLLLSKENELKTVFINNEIDESGKSFDFYSLRILTESDWSSFKKYFDKIHPNYIKKIRNAYPKITEAEERLFLCLKLNLKSKEIASVLGISNESVKKNRNRLRKKINLNIEDDLEVFVRNF